VNKEPAPLADDSAGNPKSIYQPLHLLTFLLLLLLLPLLLLLNPR
jgi:hypothetical protein